MGTTNNALVKDFISANSTADEWRIPAVDGYILQVFENGAVVASQSEAGAFYGFQSLRQLITAQGGKLILPRVTVTDYPALPFRGIRLYLPGRENFTFFRRFVKDFMAQYKFNKLILEVNGAMRLDKHPEINVGAIEFANEMNYSRRGRPEGPGHQFQNSAHHDAADGQILEKWEVADLVKYIRKFQIEVIPEVPSLTHAYYLLNRHRELAEIKQAEWPDTYCPSNPASYQLLFDVLDEYIEVIQPQMIHLGKDEWRMPVGICPICKGKDNRELFVSDIRKIYSYLQKKGIKAAMWGDHLLESVRERGLRERESSSGYKYKIPGGLTPDQVRESIPKDILIFNWFWGDKNNDRALEAFGFKQVYGNFRPTISDWKERSQWSSTAGGAPSSWAATTEFNFGKDLLYDFLGCSSLLWSGDSITAADLVSTVRYLMLDIRTYLSGERLPGQENNEIASLDLAPYYNYDARADILNLDLRHLQNGPLGESRFNLPSSADSKDKKAIVVSSGDKNLGDVPEKVAGIEIDDDASSLIFLHATARPAGNEKGYRKIYDFQDTADLIGWYEVVYEDGFIATIPLRYGVNILDISARKRDTDAWPQGKTGAPQNFYAYQADIIECAENPLDSRSFFAYEWKNPRFGKIIKSVSLCGTSSDRRTGGKTVSDNALILLAISYTKKRPVPEVIPNPAY